MTVPLVAVIAGAMISGGLFLAVRSWRTPAMSLAEYSSALTERRVIRKRGSLPLTGVLAEADHKRLRVELELCEIEPAEFVRDRFVWAGLFAAGPLMFLLAGIAVPSFVLPTTWSMILIVLGAVAGWFYAPISLRIDAAKARVQWTVTLAVYLDLVSMLVAGGAGPESALYDASSIGRGRAFHQIRAALAHAQVRHQSPWDALGALGRRLGVPDLVELAGSMELAGGGARVGKTLTVKSVAIRERDATRREGEAISRSESMVFPVLLMFVGFMLLIGYPTLASLMSTR